MNLPEFKAWFEGFSEFLEGPPNEKQWARVKEHIAELTGGEPAAAPSAPARKKIPEKPKEPYYIDASGHVLKENGDPALPEQVKNGPIWDHRGNGDLATIVWADGKTGLCNIDAMIHSV